METRSQSVDHLVRSGAAALQAGQPAEARRLFEQLTGAGRANAQIWLLLATACRADNDAAAEEAALDRLLAEQPRLLRGLLMKADCRVRAGDEGAALGFYKGARIVAQGQQVPQDLHAELQRAEAFIAQVDARLTAKREAALAAQGLPPETRSARFQQSLDIMSGQKQIFLQEPTGYFFPGLPHIQFFDTANFDWVPGVEAATAAIRAELSALLAAGQKGFRPYIQSDSNRPRLDENPLLDSLAWSTLFLCENGRLDDDVIARCPATWAAMQAVPLPYMTNSPTVMFSLLRPGARINPHTGTHNTRLVCHLPLIVPPECGFRVGNEVREWEEGKLLIFDDTIEHEAWNNSDRDRVVLIFDVWRPELSEHERREVATLFAGSAPAPE
jgi:aspartyl/asparaginyl beta-hydroxylase (cupin superfamily)